jgi:hypothetical protein
MNDPRLEQPDSRPILEFEVNHRLQCGVCNEYLGGRCECESKELFDVWELKFNDFQLDIWNKEDKLEIDIANGSVPTYSCHPIDLTLMGNAKADKYRCTLDITDSYYYLEVHDC